MKESLAFVAVVWCVLPRSALATENASTPCPAYSAGARCACDAGYGGPDGGPCEACAAGFFKAQAGSAPCASCETYGKNRDWVLPAYMTYNYSDGLLREGLHTSIGLGATACESCAANASKDSADQCECLPGYYQTVRRTVREEVDRLGGTTPPDSGLDQCVPCPEHTYKNGSGLLPCADVEWWTDDFGDTCAWYEWQSVGGAGTWPAGGCYYTGTATTASQIAFAACCACRDRHSIVAKVALYNPLSMALFTGVSRWEASQCTACPENSVAPGTGHASSSACRCAAGHSGPDGGPCAPCAAGHYKDTVGSAECTPCPSTLSSPAGSTALGSCQCPAGHSGPEGGPCAACAPGLYTPAPAPGPCVSCGASTYAAAAGASSCTDCGPGLYHAATGASAASVCAQCPAGTFRDNRYATLTCGGTCASGCSPASGALSGTISDGPASYSNFESCWWLLAASPGVEIRISFHEFKTERSYDFVTISRCSDAECAQHTQILKHSGRMSAGSVYTSTTGFLKVSFTSDHSITDDGVLANWSLSGTEGCIACSAGKYSAALGASTAAACVSCPQASSSPSGSTLATDCKCHAGHSGADGGPCAPCAAGKYKPDAGAAPCTTCPAGKYSAPGAGACSSCPESASSPSGSTLVTDCKCGAGHSGADGGPCAPCAAGKYKPDAGAAPCTTCPAGKYSAPGAGTCSNCPESASSPSGSTRVTDCKCAAGHSGADGGPCTAVLPSTPGAQRGDSTGAWFAALACVAVVCVGLGFMCTRLSLYTRVSTVEGVRL